MDPTWLETHLPLLRYQDELSAEQVAQVLEHLEALPPGSDLRAQLEGVAHALDALSLEHPHPERLRSLKEQVLLAVEAPVAPGEPATADVEPLSAAERAQLEAALDLVEVPLHPGLAGLRAAVLAEVDAEQALPADEQAEVEAALDLLGDVPLPARLAGLRGAVLGQLQAEPELTAHERAEVEAALDLWEDVERPAALDGLKARVLAEVGAPAGQLVRFPNAFVATLLAAAAVALLAVGVALGGWARGPQGFDPHGVRALKRTADFAALNGRFAIAEENYRLILEGTRAEPELLEQVRQELVAIQDYRRAQSASDPLLRQRQVATLLRDKPDALVVPAAFYHDLNRRSTAAAVQSQLAFDPSRALRFDELGVPDNVRDILTDATLQVILIQQGLRWEQLGDLIQARNCYQRALQIDPESEHGLQAKHRLSLLG
ncbi:MAG: hypothetical protein R3F62_22315 [Planctomycetota bacterium]